nr:hypothetical protein [uncultured Kingella sp.]
MYNPAAPIRQPETSEASFCKTKTQTPLSGCHQWSGDGSSPSCSTHYQQPNPSEKS